MDIPQDTLDKIRKELPTGAQNEIAEELSYSPQYISIVLGDHTKVNSKNLAIVEVAKRKVIEKRERDARLQKELNDL